MDNFGKGPNCLTPGIKVGQRHRTHREEVVTLGTGIPCGVPGATSEAGRLQRASHEARVASWSGVGGPQTVGEGGLGAPLTPRIFLCCTHCCAQLTRPSNTHF